jgi:hypothetical protein
MANIVKGLVEGIGISKKLPVNPLYFTELSIAECVFLPEHKPDIYELLSIMADVEVFSFRIADTPKAISNEGQILTGRKLIAELRIFKNIRYVSYEPVQKVHTAHFEQLVSIFVVIPKEEKNIPVEMLLQQNRINVIPYIEDIFGEVKCNRTIFQNIALLVESKFTNTPCSIQSNC